MFMLDMQHLLLVGLPMMLLLGAAQIWVSAAYRKWSKVRNRQGITGAEAAMVVLREAGINDVRVERSDGFLTDHYSPKEKVIRLSSTNYDQATIAAVGVAAHEAGHAIQHARHFFPVHLRTLAVPLASGASLGYLVIIIGMFVMGRGLNPVTLIGLLMIAGVALFQLINLPVELDASRRALQVLPRIGILDADETVGARRVLTAAAMTYVAATIAALWELLFWMMRLGLIGGRRSD